MTESYAKYAKRVEVVVVDGEELFGDVNKQAWPSLSPPPWIP